MSYVFDVNDEIISKVVKDLKDENYISGKAMFCYEKKENPNKEIYYNDYVFLDALGYYRTEETMREVVSLLKSKQLITQEKIFLSDVFNIYSYIVKNKFVVPWKSFTPAMEKLVFLLSMCKKPAKMIAVGINCGYTLAWLCGFLFRNKNDDKENNVYAIEKNPILLDIAKNNMKKLDLQDSKIKYIAEDASNVLERFHDEYFDMAFLDTRSNFEILEKLNRKLKSNGWLLMHNASDPHFEKEMKKYLDFVRDRNRFSESILFHIDTKGLELSIKT